MTPNQVVAAYRAVLELSKTVLPYPAARQIAALNRAMKAEHEAVVDAEKALAEKYGGTVSSGGTVDFPDWKRASDFNKAHTEFMEQDAEIQLPTVDITPYAERLQVSPEAICALDGIVIFEKDRERAVDNG